MPPLVVRVVAHVCSCAVSAVASAAVFAFNVALVIGQNSAIEG